jgi:hypothetical protein
VAGIVEEKQRKEREREKVKVRARYLSLLQIKFSEKLLAANFRYHIAIINFDKDVQNRRTNRSFVFVEMNFRL